jgi:kinesin family protein C1
MAEDKDVLGSEVSASGRKSSKRKSFENSENVNTNQLLEQEQADEKVSKKVKVLQPLVEGTPTVNVLGSSVPAKSGMPVRSALPRFQASRKPSVTTAPTVTPKKTATIASTTSAATASANREKANIRGAIVDPTTPGKSLEPRTVLASVGEPVAPVTTATPRISNNPFLRKLQREILSEITGAYLTQMFDNSFGFIDERVTATMGTLKVKSKWDVKEKMKRLESVIKELKDIVALIQEGVRNAKDSANNFEQKAFNGLRESYDHLVDDAQIIATLRNGEKKLVKDNENLVAEMKELNFKLDSIKSEHTHQLRLAETKALLAEKENEMLKERLVEADRKVEKLRKEQEEIVSVHKASLDKHTEDAGKIYRAEIAMLQTQLAKVELDLERTVRDQDEATKKNGASQDEIFSLRSQLRDSESAKDSLERDVARLNGEARMLRETVSKKDDDIRNSMNSVYELQKQVMEEKNSLWQELTVVSNKARDLEEERRTLAAQMAAQKEEISLLTKDVAQLTEAKTQLESTLATKEIEFSSAKDAHVQLEIERELRSRCEMREESERRERIAATAQALAIQSESARELREAKETYMMDELRFKNDIEQLSKQLDETQKEAKNSFEISAGLRKEIEQLHLALADAPSNHESVEKLGRATGEIEVLRQKLADLTSHQEQKLTVDAQKFRDLEDKLKASEVSRRKLHNLVQELRGNIRVFARVRPFLPGDGYDLSKEMPDSSILTRSDMNSLRISTMQKTPAGDDKIENHEFQFDKVFGPSTTQDYLFNEVAEFVQSALDGYQVCLFSYGQTGSGKTHTMNGSGEGSMRGIIPRAMEQVGAYKKELQEKGWQYFMEVSFLEIYNETIRDLLRPANQPEGKHDIKKDMQGNVTVTELTRMPVDAEDFNQIMSIMELAAQHRSTSTTLMNDRSSRSHAVFTLHLRAVNPQQGIELNGALNLVDLAGSERVDRSGVSGQDFKETVAINKSLSSLADVFSALASKQPHVPFRNSKLTYLLQPALSGDGKTLMIVNLSPTQTSFFESLSSLRFANQVSQCELGKPKRRLKDMSAAASSTASSSSASSAMDVCEPTTPSRSTSGASTPATGGVSTKKGATWDGVKLKGALDNINVSKLKSGTLASTSSISVSSKSTSSVNLKAPLSSSASRSKSPHMKSTIGK